MPVSGLAAGNVRTIIAIAAVTNQVHVVGFDPTACGITVADPNKLTGTLHDVGIQDFQMSLFRDILAGMCPEIRASIQDPAQFPMSAGISIGTLIEAVGAALMASPNFQGNCLLSV